MTNFNFYLINLKVEKIWLKIVSYFSSPK